MVVTIPEIAARQKAARIRLVVTDVDGVLTDTGVFYSDKAEEFKRFSVRDGMGVQRLRELAGIPTAIVTGEYSLAVKRRAEKLNIDEVFLRVLDKEDVLNRLAVKLGLSLDEIAYIGDDVNDLTAIQAVGVSACPADAMDQVRAVVTMICGTRGGYGAFREFADWILASRNAL